MPDWALTILQSYGLAGIVILALGYVVVYQNKSVTKLNDDRWDEKEILIKALESNTAAIKDNARATEERNRVTEQLAEAIEKLATAFEMFSHKTEMHNENVRERLADQKLVIDSVAEASRTNTGVIRDVRNILERLR